MGEVFTKKIAFVGSLSTGKTTVFNSLKAKFSGGDYIFIPESAREILENRRIKGSEITEEIEYEMQDMNFINELKAYEAKPKFILCDRSVIDPVVYALAEGDTDRADRLLARMRHWLQTYHQFILFDKEGIPYKQDEFRDEDYKYRDKVHDSFIDFFSSLNIPYVVAAGDSENRTDFIERLLAEK